MLVLLCGAETQNYGNNRRRVGGGVRCVKETVRGVMFGAALTMLVQSSSVVVGLTVLSVAGGLLDPTLSIWVVVGANLGTGWVAHISGWGLGTSARRVALVNAGLDLAGLALCVTVLHFASRPLRAIID